VSGRAESRELGQRPDDGRREGGRTAQTASGASERISRSMPQ
jgi:hypothetical protein